MEKTDKSATLIHDKKENFYIYQILIKIEESIKKFLHAFSKGSIEEKNLKFLNILIAL